MMPSSGSNRSYGRHNRSSGDGGHISPQGNYNQSRNGGSNGGGAAMDAPGSYRMASVIGFYFKFLSQAKL